MKNVKTPIKVSGLGPSLDELARIYKISKKRQKEIHDMVVARGWVRDDKPAAEPVQGKLRKTRARKKSI